ncbi:MAG: DNA/RNA non-specific endonuclease [Bacteroidota bacterium]
MTISKKQRFGLITLMVLLILAILVTTEPWKGVSPRIETALLDAAPMNIRIHWDRLDTGYPVSPLPDSIHSYAGFDLAYNETYEQASWVAYVLTREEVEKGFQDRTENFRADASIISGSAELNDYRGSGYDRGHLAPAGDMKWSSKAMSESFLLSNMSPQNPSFNRGIWKELEEQVREWAVEKDSIYVVTGPVLSTVEYSIGESQVGVPEYYFKVLADLSPPGHSFIAFLLPNKGSSEDLKHFAISVDSLELFTGYNFFASAPDQDVIEWLERHLDLDSWN